MPRRSDFRNLKIGVLDSNAGTLDVELMGLEIDPSAFPSDPYVLTPPLSDRSKKAIAWGHSVIGILPPWVTDGNNWETHIHPQLQWANYCGMHAALCPTPPTTGALEYGRALQSVPGLPIWVRWSIDDWDRFKDFMKPFEGCVRVALELKEIENEHQIDGWIGELLPSVIIPLNLFKTNPHKKPALLPLTANILRRILDQTNANVLLEAHPNAKHDMESCVEYVQATYFGRPALPNEELEGLEYRDFVQVPLEPIRCNLESSTYEIFESDSTKYDAYGRAIGHALDDRNEMDDVTIAIVGAGRGPLVHQAITQAKTKRPDRRTRIVAVEKNPAAAVTLRLRVRDDILWRDVEIYQTDVRKWEPEFNVDILVSELLGSFGDNELSPECLDDCTRFLSPTATSIPSSYSSYVEPIVAATAWNHGRTGYKSFHEQLLVVKFHCAEYPSVPQKLFSFHHPCIGKMDNSNNRRSTQVEFKVSRPSRVYGLATYFDCQLSKSETLSTVRTAWTDNLYSWFPGAIFFPKPIFVEHTLKVAFWRESRGNTVWYEWAVVEPTQSEVYNLNGTSCVYNMF